MPSALPAVIYFRQRDLTPGVYPYPSGPPDTHLPHVRKQTADPKVVAPQISVVRVRVGVRGTSLAPILSLVESFAHGPLFPDALLYIGLLLAGVGKKSATVVFKF